MVAKAAGVVIGVGLIGAGSIAMAKPHWLGMDYMPSWKPLSKDSNYDTTKASDYGENKFGNKRGNYLTGVIGNESWWEWSFRRLKSDNPPTEGKFKYKNGDETNVDAAYDHKSTGTPNAKALNQICKAAFKEQDTNVDTNGGETKFKKSEVWKYCSPLGKEPTKISDRNDEKNRYNGNIGGTNSEHLVSVEDKDNDLFWEIRDKEVKGNGDFEKNPSTGTDNYFGSKSKTLKDLCKDAYRKNDPGSGSGQPDATSTKKYCGLIIS